MTARRGSRAGDPMNGGVSVAASVYIATGIYELADRTGEAAYRPRPMITGISDDLDRLLVELERARNKRLEDRAALHRSWRGSNEFEAEAEACDLVFEVPMNTMTNARRARTLYGSRHRRGERFLLWGPLDAPVTDREVAERHERAAFRAENRDADDPWRDIVAASEKRLPKPAKKARLLYVAFEYKSWKRTLGVFDDYDVAALEAPDAATIIEVAANGYNHLEDGKLVRGHFPSGWGYAAGYSPGARAAAQVL